MLAHKSYKKVEELLSAVERKVNITHYHYENLKTLDNSHSTGMPSIPIQACFEGVIIAAYSSIDKLMKALIELFPNEGISKKTLDTLKPLVQCIPSVGRLITKNSFYVDLQKVRSEAIHEVQTKSPGGPDSRWEIKQPSKSDYSGGRSILEYAKTALDFAADCQPIINEIRQKFVGFNGTTNQARHPHCGNYPLDRR